MTPAAHAPGTPRRGMRRAALMAIVGAVTLLHAEAAREIAADWLDFTQATMAMPARMQVAYVRVLSPEAPPVVAPVAALRVRPRAAASARTAIPHHVVAAASAVADADTDVTPPTQREVAMADEPSPMASAPVAAAESEPASASAASSPAATPFVWPASTRVSYVLTGNFRGEVSGQAQVEWIHAGDRYQVNLDLVVGPSFAPLITRRMTSDGTLSAAGLVPDRYDQDTKVVLRERQRVSVRFEPDAIVLADGRRSARPDGVQDTASQFVQLTYRFTTEPALLRAGNTIDVPLALPRKTDHWLYDVLAEETLATPLGPLQAFHLKPRRPERAPGELLADIWFAPTLRYLPVRIRIEQDASTFIDLLIARPPDMAAS